MTFLDDDYREIITKAVCGRGRKCTRESNVVCPNHKPSSILGCWVINHKYSAKKVSEDTVEVKGSYDINVWYSYNNNTRTDVVTECITYKDSVPLSVRDDNCIGDEYDVVVKVIQQPNCLECEIKQKEHKISAEVERELLVQVIGETKLCVKVAPNDFIQDDCDDEFWDSEFTDEDLRHVDSKFLNRSHRD